MTHTQGVQSGHGRIVTGDDGGGGGGGHFGGGGGGTGPGGGGGGGGSGFVHPSATNASQTPGVQSGNGRIHLAWVA